MKDMSLESLVYVSTAADNFQAQHIQNLLEECKVNNKESSITGLLCFNHLYFLQYIEGESQEVEATFHKISKDLRHKNIKIISREVIEERQFEEWEMGYVLLSEDMREITDKYLNQNDFSPYEAEPTEIFEFIIHSKEQLITI